MAVAQVEPHWRYHDLRAIVLENASLRLTVLQVISSNFGSAAAASSLLLLAVFLPLLVWNLRAEEKAMILT